MWLCDCDCGKQTTVALGNLRSGQVISCGCRRKEVLDKKTHGRSHLVEYNTWKKMIARCTDSSVEKYDNYGGRGIKVCAEWLNSFENFYADLGKRPPNTSLGRKDNNGDYGPANCSWESIEQQANNKSNTRKVTYNGETKSVAQWAKELDINKYTLYSRLNVMSVERAMTLR